MYRCTVAKCRNRAVIMVRDLLKYQSDFLCRAHLAADVMRWVFALEGEYPGRGRQIIRDARRARWNAKALENIFVE